MSAVEKEKNMKFCDLHTHSNYSDGTYTPAELVEAAVNAGLSAIALTDHNSVDGLPEFLKAAESKNIEAIPGVEFSVDYSGKELHLVALFIQEEHFAAISEMMEDGKRRKEQSNIELVHALNAAGYKIEYEKIKAASPSGNINRAHIAAALTEAGYVKSREEAFLTILSPEVGFYKPPKRLDFFDMVRYVKNIGAVPVLAHPFLKLSEEELTVLLPRAKEAGLIGIECCYSTHNEEQTKTAFYLADRFNLKYSGGSDFHGDNKPDIAIGTGKGNLRVPYAFAEALKL